MANVAIFKIGEAPQYVKSVDIKDFVVSIPPYKDVAQQYAKPDVLINPDISAVSSIPVKFWKRVGNAVVEMTAAEKQVVLDAELLARKAQADTFGVSPVDIFTALIKVINIRLPQGQKITKQELIDAVKAEVT